MDDKELALELWRAQALRLEERSSFQKALCLGKSQLNTLRRVDSKRATKRQREAGIVFRAGINATQLVYPQDVPKLAAKKGTTYDPRTRRNAYPSCDDYVNSKLHLEKVLVLWGGRWPRQDALGRGHCKLLDHWLWV